MFRRWSAMSLTLLLAACGGESGGTSPAVPATCGPTMAAAQAPVEPVATATPKPAKSTSTKPKPAPKATAAPAAAGGTASTPAAATAAPAAAAAPSADQLLAEVKQTSLALSTFKATLNSSEYRWDKTRAPLVTQIALSYQTPGNYRFEMVNSTQTGNIGTKMVYRQGETKVSVKPSGILSVLTVSLALTDPKLLTDNNYRIDQITLQGVLERVTGSGYHATVAGTSKVGGEPVTVLKVTNDHNTLDPHIDYEYIGYDKNKLYRMWTAFGKPEFGVPNNVLHRMEITNIENSPNITADTFKL